LLTGLDQNKDGKIKSPMMEIPWKKPNTIGFGSKGIAHRI
jgi:hypothetical protein